MSPQWSKFLTRLASLALAALFGAGAMLWAIMRAGYLHE